MNLKDMENIIHVFKIFVLLWVATGALKHDRQCIPRHTEFGSVCVCNATYCDTVTRETPSPGTFISYTSSKSGLRFQKRRGLIEGRYTDTLFVNLYDKLFDLQPYEVYQTVEGFGGAVTDSAGLNWRSLPPAAQQNLINSYCSKYGIEFNMIRVPCGATDYSPRFWTYNESPANDTQFTNFTLSYEDINYKVPMIQACMKVATADVDVITAIWSPPKWMLTTERPSGFNMISNEFRQAYADYHCKFAELYKEQGIKIWGSSIANEPLSFIEGGSTELFMSWTGPDMITFLAKYFGPTMRNCSVEGIKILAVDDQRFALPFWTFMMQQSKNNAIDYIDGVALHYYADNFTSPAIVSRAKRDYPGKFFINTEACTGFKEKDNPKVQLGSWTRAKQYINDILENLNYDLVGWLDWNMCLDTQGGPSWLNFSVDSPIIVNADKGEFYKQPMYYGFGHFSKFIPRGSKRIGILKKPYRCILDSHLRDIEEAGQKYFDSVAFLTPRGTTVVVIHNDGPAQAAAIQIEDQQISVLLEEESVTTVEFCI